MPEATPTAPTAFSSQDWRHWLVARARADKLTTKAFLMWFRACYIYFRSEYHPAREVDQDRLHLKNFSPEVAIFFHGLAGQIQYAAHLVPPALLERHQFADYLRSLLEDNVGWPVLESHYVPRSTQDEHLLWHIDHLAQFRTLAYHMSQTPHLAYPAFVVFGRIYQQAVSDSNFGRFLFRLALLPELDDIPHKIVREVCQDFFPPSARHLLAWTMAKFYQWLYWLSLMPARDDEAGIIRRSYMIFILINHEFQQLNRLWEREDLTHTGNGNATWFELFESMLFAIGMELKKVIHGELVDFPALTDIRQAYIRIENSQGILRNSLQQAVVSIIQHVYPEIDGRTLFASYQNRLEESLELRNALWELKKVVMRLWQNEDWAHWSHLTTAIAHFADHALRYLMYKDWQQFETFQVQLQSVNTPTTRRKLLDQLNAFLGTLIKEINKRDVLRNYPFPYEIGDE